MKTLALIILLSFFAGVALAQDTLPDLPMGVEAQSLFGENLTSSKPSVALLANYESAKVTFDADPYDADNIIWYGRRVAYLGRYREAIEIYSKGLKEHPNDARLYRHRGHRYISIREFDRAIEDFEKAAALIEGMENEVEPDGVSNLLGIPISSLHGNIFYHLGLSYYLKQDWENALRAYRNGFNSSRNDDNRVSTTYWIYLILLRMERPGEAQEALDVI